MSKLLIVDDEEDICDFLKDFFESQTGCDVFTASDPETALKLLQEEKPKGVLLDIKLGSHMTGLDILDSMRVISPESKTIMVTASYDQQTMQKALSLGAVDYITKPFSLDYLEKTVRSKITNILE